MGTRISVELWQQDDKLAAQALDAVMATMRQVEAAMSPYIESSELSTINRLAATQPVKISDPLFNLIDKSLYFSRVSEGAFDISYASVGRYYNYRESLSPSEQQLGETLKAIGYRGIQLNSAQRSIRFLHPKLSIDLGGIAKGYAVDSAIDALHKLGIESAIVSAGGDSRVLGQRHAEDDKATPWMIGIRHPRKSGEYAVRLPLANTAVSTSGDYERFFIRDGERIHHIINPSTGKSASAVQSVTVLANLAADSDALSTTVFVLGVKKGLALVNRLPGVDAIVIDAEGLLHYSDGLLRAAGEN